MDAAAVASFRRFNRTVTQRIGALDDHFLARDRPLGQSRVLWEIPQEGIDVRSLRARLDLDSGYLTRLLQALAADGLVTIEVSPGDARVRTARLTAAGAAEREQLDRAADAQAASILAALDDHGRERLLAAMYEVERLLVGSALQIAVVHPRSGPARECLTQYFAELDRRFENGFDADLGLPTDDADFTAPHGAVLVATLGDQPVGTASLRIEAGDVAHLKRMWVSPAVRGVGLGRMLLDRAERAAAELGANIIQLETNDALAEAIALYRSAGYREVPPFNDERYAHHWFEKRLTPSA